MPTIWPALAALAAALPLGLALFRVSSGALFLHWPGVREYPWMGVCLLLGLACALPLAILARHPRPRWMGTIGSRAARLRLAAVPFVPTIGLGLALLRPPEDTLYAAVLLILVIASLTAYAVGLQSNWKSSLTRLPFPVGSAVSHYWAAIAVTLATLLVYILTAAPSVVIGDGGEMQTVAATLGVAHPTGYPLYTIVGKLFVLLPLGGDAAFRVTLLSAVAGALGAGVLCAFLERLTKSTLASTTAALTFAFTPLAWSQAVAAEVYAPQTLLMGISLGASLALARMSATATQSTWARRLLIVNALTIGLGLAHHRMTVLALPAFILAALFSGRVLRWDWKLAGAAITAVLLPLASYLYLPMRWEAAFGAGADWQTLWWHISGSGWGDALQWQAIWTDTSRYALVCKLFCNQIGPVLAVFSASGLVWTALRAPRLFLVLAAFFLCNLLFAVAYHVPDVVVFLTPSILAAVCWGGFGAAAMVRVLTRLNLRMGGTALVIASLLLWLPLYSLAANLSAADQSGDQEPRRWAERALASGIEPLAMVVSDIDRLAPLRYLLSVEHRDKSVTVTMPDSEAQSYALIDAALRSGHPAYLARYLPGAADRYYLDGNGPLVRAWPRSQQKPPTTAPARALSWEAVEGIALVGISGPLATADTVELGQSGIVPLWLHWWTKDRPTLDYRFRLVLRSPSDTMWYSTPWRHPLAGQCPTHLWESGESVTDYWELNPPRNLPALDYRLELQVTAGQEEPIARRPLGVVKAPAAPQALAPCAGNSTLYAFDASLALTCVGYSTPAFAGSAGTLRTNWLALGTRRVDYQMTWSLTNGITGQVVLQDQGAFYEGESQPSQWSAGSQHTLDTLIAIPSSLSAGSYDLRIALIGPAGDKANVSGQWPWQRGHEVSLGPIEVKEATSTLTNFGNEAILLAHSLSPSELRAGSDLALELRWQAVGRIDKDYTVFVHLLDSKGLVRAQLDRYPVDGTRPTSQWQQTEIVYDRYELPLSVDLPAGEYSVEIGLYLASTMERVPIVDASLRPIADHLLLGKVAVIP